MDAGLTGVADREHPLSLHPEQADAAVPKRPRPIDWLFTFPFLLAFGGLLVLFDPLQRIARLFGRRSHEFTAGALQVTLVWAFRLCGTRIEVERAAGVQPDTAYLVRYGHHPVLVRADVIAPHAVVGRRPIKTPVWWLVMNLAQGEAVGRRTA